MNGEGKGQTASGARSSRGCGRQGLTLAGCQRAWSKEARRAGRTWAAAIACFLCVPLAPVYAGAAGGPHASPAKVHWAVIPLADVGVGRRSCEKWSGEVRAALAQMLGLEPADVPKAGSA